MTVTSRYIAIRFDLLKWADDNNKHTLAKVLREELNNYLGQLELF